MAVGFGRIQSSFVAGVVGGERPFAVGIRGIVAAEVDVGDAAEIMAGGAQAEVGRVVIRGRGIVAEEGEEAVVTVLGGQAGAREIDIGAGIVPNMAAGGFGNIGDRRRDSALRRVMERGFGNQGVSIRIGGREAADGIVVVAALEVIVPAPPAVVVRQVLDDILAGLTLGGPGPAVAGGFAAVEEIIQKYEPRSNRMKVGRDVLAEENDGRVAVALGQVAENLVVGAVLFDDVDDVLDAAGFEVDGREWIGGGHVRRGRRADLRQAVVADDLLRFHPKLRGVRHGNGLHRAFDQVKIVLAGEAELLVGWVRVACLRPFGIGDEYLPS